MLDALASVGAREVVLEALTVNVPALGLYQRHFGFELRRRLVGFERRPGGKPIDPAHWEQALAATREPASWQLDHVVRAAREQADLTSVPAVVPERHAVAAMLAEEGFALAEMDQYELGRSLE